MRKQDNEMDLENFVSHNEKNIVRCLVPECQTVFEGKSTFAIKRHYQIEHDTDIEENENNVGEGNQTGIYSSKYRDNAKTKLNNSKESIEDKGYRKFIVADYVEYCKYTNTSKCLIKNCERHMSGRRTGNIKRHYHKVHNLVIVPDNPETMRAIDNELNVYYNNDKFCDSTLDDENEDEMSDSSEHNSTTTYFEKYIEYDPLIKKSLCKVPGCKTYLEGKNPVSIKRHYVMVHNLKMRNGPLLSSLIIPIDDYVVYDIKSSSYQCLFVNCNQNLLKHLPTIKRHYHEIHKIIIAKTLDNVPYSLYKKRKCDEIAHHYESEFSRGDDEYTDETMSYVIKNEFLSDDEQPRCSKRPCMDSVHSKQSFPSQMSSKINKAMTKSEFFVLCLNLIIEHDLKINIFDDEKYFKKILTPFENVFNCKVNSIVMQDMLIEANDTVVSGLKEKFANKIVGLELNVVNLEKKYYLIFNVRYLNEQFICNTVIGFLPITDSGAVILPIFEYLSKFNIDKEQVYMTTLVAGLLDNKEIDKIFNNIRKHNPDIKSHPICYMQTTLRSFVEKYSKNIKSWQELVKYDCKLNSDEFNNLNEISCYIENLSETDIKSNKPEMKKAKHFFKSFKILRNFIEKLSEEQYVAGDFYRDWLCCELELKNELTKTKNVYAGELCEDLEKCKNTLLQSSEFIAALYLDARFNFLGSRLINDAQKTEGKLILCSIWEKFKKYIQLEGSETDTLLVQEDSNDDLIDDKYALLNQHINDITPVKSSICVEDMITNCIPTKREPLSLNILKYWHCRAKDMKDINELTKIVFTFSSSQYILNCLQKNFTISLQDNDKFDKFLIKNNQYILEKNFDLLFKDKVHYKTNNPVYLWDGLTSWFNKL